MRSQRFKKPPDIRAKDELKPKVEPNYKRESPPWLKVVSLLSMLGSIVLMALTAIMGQEFTALMGATLSMLLAGCTSVLKGDYTLAIRLVNSASVEEWSYNSGTAVMKLPGGVLAILDTKLKKLYLSREFSVQGCPLIEGRAKPSVKFVVSIKSKTVKLGTSRGFKRVRILKGVAETPSIKSEKEVMRLFGTFLEVKLEKACLKGISTCIKELTKMLEEGLDINGWYDSR